MPTNYDTAMPPAPSSPAPGRLLGTVVIFILGTLLTATFFQTCLSSRQLASSFVSPATWGQIVLEGGKAPAGMIAPDFVNLPFSVTLLPIAIVAVLTWVAGAIWLTLRRGLPFTESLIQWGWYGWLWWCLVDAWEWVWILAGSVAPASVAAILSVTPQVWFAGCFSGWMTTWLSINARRQSVAASDQGVATRRWLWFVCGLYVLVFITMNWRLYFNLLVPHGDSVMYEEHLWNLLHGKGFRSYLDRGLFFGEHIQFVHLFLLPLYLLWPSHLLLEAASSTALALGAFPVYWMAKRHTGSDRAAFGVAVAYLLYFPMQFLDIEIDLKTFRPESFGIPLLLLTLDQVDRRHVLGTLMGIAFCLTVKEDYTLIFGPLGLWIAASPWIDRRPGLRPSAASTSPLSADDRRERNLHVVLGLSLSLFSVLYLWITTRVVMPWFRSGVEVHYASYFSRFGKTPEEILRTWITQPGTLVDALITPDTVLYAIALLAPVAFLPLFSPGRLAVGLPLFSILCLNELEGSRTPQHQFHAPLVAVVFWSLSAAIPVASRVCAPALDRIHFDKGEQLRIDLLGRIVWVSSLSLGIFFSLGPLGLTFWDPGSSWNWKKLYGPTSRADKFARIASDIPQTARVASTDFVHPRFTHHERSYDYSGYQREVSGEGKRIPDDTDYIVIDTDHKYSRIKRPEEIPEYRDHPERWQLLPDKTDGMFIILQRKPGNDSSQKQE